MENTNLVPTGNMVAEANTGVATVDSEGTLLDGFHSTNDIMFCTIQNDGKRETGIKIYNALNNSYKKISEVLGVELHITDFIAHPVQILNAQKELTTVIRLVLVDEKGLAYDSVSEGIVASVQKLQGMVGFAPWTPALKMKVVEKVSRNGLKYFTIELVG